MNSIIKAGLLIFIVVGLSACGQQDASAFDSHAELSPAEMGDIEAAFTEADDDGYHDPYMEFCLHGEKRHIDPNTLEDDDCLFRTEGHVRGDLNAPKINAFYASVSEFPGLEKAGIDTFTMNIKIGPKAPKITPGVYSLKPYAILSTEKRALPDIIMHLHAFREDSVFNAVMQPDIAKIKQSPLMQPEHYPGYEIVSATLNITHVEDIPPSEQEKDKRQLEAEMGIFSGTQYIKGTFSFTIKKFGPSGADFGPATFTFASHNDWAYFPEMGKAN